MGVFLTLLFVIWVGYLLVVKAKKEPPKSTLRDGTQEFHRNIKAALDVVDAYGEVMEHPPLRPPGVWKFSEAELPFSKEQVMKACSLLLRATENPGSRTLIIELFEPALAQYMLSAKYKEALQAGLLYLERFVPADEAMAEYRTMEGLLAKVPVSTPND